MTIRRYTATLPVLAAHGLAPGPAGFEVADLYALAAYRGWLAHAERSTARGPGRRWRATVVHHRRETANPIAVLVGGTSGHGGTEAEALAVALAGMLSRYDVG